MPGNFEAATRRQIVKWTPMTSVGGNTTSVPLPRAGLLSSLRLLITGSVTGVLSAPNALGMASILKRVRLTVNNGTDLFNVSGAGYHYLLRNFLNDYHDPVPASNARSAVTATTFDISLLIPIALSNRDLIGLVNLQNEQTQITLSCDWETAANVATGATLAITAQPFVELFTLPLAREDYPPLNLLHQCVEEQTPISGAGDAIYNLPRGNTYLQMLFGLGIGVAGVDGWSAVALRQQQTNFIFNGATPAYFSNEYAESHNAIGAAAARLLGVIPFDFLGSSGMGAYGKFRDPIDSSQLTDLAAVITATGAGTLFALRRQLVPMLAG